MQTKELKIILTLKDLNKFAPDGIEFVLNDSGFIESVAKEFKVKYPEINMSENIFNTCIRLQDLETVIGKYEEAKHFEVEDRQVPVGFEGKTADDIFNTYFCKLKLFQNNPIMQKRELSKEDMHIQTSKLEEYGRLNHRYKQLGDLIRSIDKDKAEIQSEKHKNKRFNLASLFKNNEKKYDDSLDIKKQKYEEERQEVNTKKGIMSWGLNFNPRLMLVFAVRKAAMEKIQAVLTQFDFYKKSGLVEVVDFVKSNTNSDEKMVKKIPPEVMKLVRKDNTIN